MTEENKNKAITGTAVVLSSTGSRYSLRDSETGKILDSGIRGKIRLKEVRTTNPVAVGDIVDYLTDPTGQTVITSIHQRTNYIIRRSPNLSRESHIIASNLDRAMLVVSLFLPETSTEFIDRFLVTCEAYGVPATIVLNKLDMAEKVPGAVEEFTEIYRSVGYPVLPVSAVTGKGLDTLKTELQNKTTLFSGNSGVGKSSLIKALIPDAAVQTAQISDYHHKGKHTTTYARMYTMPEGGDIIDTPGIKGFGLIDIEPAGLYRYFPEMLTVGDRCQYYNCTHVHEPGCAVMEAVSEGKIPESRYVSYLKILENDGKYRKGY